ncbi:MAG: TGS domain-containing protein, partial [Candidatus Micrarchaeales archaeon]
LAAADVLILVADASGKSDPNGNPCTSCNPIKDVTTVNDELVQWIASIIKKHISKLSKRSDGVNALGEILTGLKIDKDQISAAIGANGLPSVKINWSDEEASLFAKEILTRSKPILIAANKSDVKGSDKNIESLKSDYGEKNVVGTSAAIEFALRKAHEQNIIGYIPGVREFEITDPNVTKEQRAALDYMSLFLKEKGTNVQELINRSVFSLLDNIVVYPVEDENKYTDGFGNVLPDAILLKKGSTALELAESIHTDIAKSMLYAIDARTKMRLARDHVLKDSDVIKIVSTAK